MSFANLLILLGCLALFCCRDCCLAREDGSGPGFWDRVIISVSCGFVDMDDGMLT